MTPPPKSERLVHREPETVMTVVERWCRVAYATNIRHPLLAAIRFGDVVDVATVHEHGRDCLSLVAAMPFGVRHFHELLNEDGTDRRFGSALGYAAAGNDLKVVQYLLEAGATTDDDEPGASDGYYVSGFHVTRVPLDHPINKPKKTAFMPPLHCAVVNQNAAMVRVLLDAGADVNAKSVLHEGCAPLHLAAERESTEIVRMLLDRGAQIDAVHQRGSWHLTPLCVAVDNYRLPNARLLLDRGACIHGGGGPAVPPLVLAEDIPPQEKERLIAELIRRGADVNMPDPCGKKETPLIAAAKSGDPGAVRALLAARANIAATDADSRTALMHACIYARNEIAALLMTCPGAEETLNMRDAAGDSALDFAVRAKNDKSRRMRAQKIIARLKANKGACVRGTEQG